MKDFIYLIYPLFFVQGVLLMVVGFIRDIKLLFLGFFILSISLSMKTKFDYSEFASISNSLCGYLVLASFFCGFYCATMCVINMNKDEDSSREYFKQAAMNFGIVFFAAPIVYR